MPCDTRVIKMDAKLARARQLDALEQQLKDKSAKLALVNGVASVEGWKDRGDWCDECAVRALRLSSDFEVRQAATQLTTNKAVISYGHGHSH